MIYIISGGVSLPTLFFFRISLAIFGILHFHIHFRISMSSSTQKNLLRIIMIGIVLTIDNLERIYILQY